ncbi:hypothetical protein BOTBODRAFT_612620 [Botryobasidium botryosum FD-172 SS1]|uniref:Uncharacterized protein n=1 Tax=Botryobasidium botryosum (strain FD-172 SS1) TaxID=930990 RepID=A0A067LVH8_BOTB1|nr:hypothetical protein BOTBODRAFT_612620 [Botryobasidium botryosum FD-172 SS1]
MAPFVPPLTPDMSSPVRGPHPRRVAFALPPSASATAPVTPAPASAPRSPMSPPPTQPRVPTHPAQLPTPQTLPHSPSPSQSSSVGRYHDALGDLSDIPAIPEDHDMPDVDMFDDSEIRMPGPDHDEDLAPLLVKIRSLEEELDGAKRHLSVKNTEIEDLRQQLAHMESFAAQRDHAEQRLRLIQADYIAGLHDRDALQARISEKEQALDEVRTHVRELEQTVARLSEVEREKAALAAERDALSAEIAQVKQDKADSQALCDAIKVRLDDSARDATTLRSDLAAARETTELYTRHLRAALEENSAKRDDILRLQNRFKESADDLEVARETTRVLEATVEEKETQAATWTARLAVLAAEMDELRTHLDESRRQTTLADSSLATMRRQLEDAVRKRTEETNALQFRLQKRQDELETARRKLTDAHAAVAAAATKMEQLERQLEEERAASAERQARDEARMHALEATIAKHDSNIATLTRDIRTMSTQLREREADLDASNAERARVSRLFEAEQATHNDTRKQKVILEGQLEETEDQLQTAKEMNEKMVNTWRSLIPGMTQMNGLVDDTAEPPRRTRSRRISDSGIGL